jgi:hypothetical protein
VKASLLVACLATAGSARAADPVVECIGQNERSLELRKQGKLLDARRELASCAAAPCPDAIQQACRARMGEVNGAIPGIVLDVKDAAGQDLLDAQLSIDGQPVGAVGVTARQLDPGRHVSASRPRAILRWRRRSSSARASAIATRRCSSARRPLRRPSAGGTP